MAKRRKTQQTGGGGVLVGSPIVESDQKSEPQVRIKWLDAARGVGMALIFFGHLVEALTQRGIPAALPSYKAIYAFHMPLFFILSGYLGRGFDAPWGVFVRHRLFARIVPAAFFNLLALAIWLVQDASMGRLGGASDYLRGSLSLLRGYPSFNVVAWFLFALFTTECVHYAARGQLARPGRYLFFIAVVLGGGLLITSFVDDVSAVTGIAKNVWYVHEALVAYFFFGIGAWMAQQKVLDERKGAALLPGAVVCGAVAGATFSLNDGPFVALFPGAHISPVVVMGASSHGNPLLFVATALSGSFCVVLLVAGIDGLGKAGNRLLEPVRAVGRDSLAYLGLAGLFLHFVNDRVLDFLGQHFPSTVGSPVLAAALIALASLIVSYPVAVFLRRSFPQLLGRPRRAGPVLPAFERASIDGSDR